MAPGAASERTGIRLRRTNDVVSASAYLPPNSASSAITSCSATAWKNFVLTGVSTTARASRRPMSAAPSSTSSAVGRLASLRTMPPSASRNAPVNTREKLWAARVSCDAGPVEGRVSGSM